MERIFQKSFDNITSIDIQHLLEIKYKERQRMEYKKEMYKPTDKDRKEMLRDISSIANAYGGYLIIGIEASKDGIPTKPFHIDNAEEEKDRIEQSCLSNIEPRIVGLKCKAIKLDAGEEIIIIFIPRSLKKPHMINFQQLNQFWIRHNDKKFPMSVEEIREACINVENIWKDVKLFLDERKEELNKEAESKQCLVIGSSPVITREDFIDIRDSDVRNFLIDPPNQIGESCALSFKITSTPESFPEPTLNGLKIKYKNNIAVELFRNGYYELKIDFDWLLERDEIEGIHIHKRSVIEYTVNYFRALCYLAEQFGIESNFIAFMVVFNIGNTKLISKRVDPRKGHPYKQERRLEKKQNLDIPARQIISFDNPDKIAKSFLEKFWNAFGFEEVPYFKNDKYNPKES